MSLSALDLLREPAGMTSPPSRMSGGGKGIRSGAMRVPASSPDAVAIVFEASPSASPAPAPTPGKREAQPVAMSREKQGAEGTGKARGALPPPLPTGGQVLPAWRRAGAGSPPDDSTVLHNTPTSAATVRRRGSGAARAVPMRPMRTPKPSVVTPTSYVPPTEKRRDDLRFQIRV